MVAQRANLQKINRGGTRWVGVMALTLLLVVPSPRILGHNVGPAGEQLLSWHTSQISQVLTTAGAPGREATLEGKDCLVGGGFYFNVRDEFAFDIDEDVQLTLEFALSDGGPNVDVEYEENGVSSAVRHLTLPNRVAGNRWHTETLVLERARFASNGEFGSDFSIRGVSRPDGISQSWEITVCGVSLQRSYRTPRPAAYGNLLLQVVDETNRATPARVGIYDQRDRMPLPSEDAVPVRQLMGVSRVVKLNRYPTSSIPRSDHWPFANQSAFYIKGHYGARLPVGRYDVVVGKGPEYRIARQSFTVRAQETVPVTVPLSRWDNLRGKGWFSGEDHIHYTRESAEDDRSLLLMAQAEDLHVANIMQMGNAANIHFCHYDWKIVTDPRNSASILVPGQEDPRTNHRGHTLHLNLKEPVRDPSRYLLYEEVFERVRAQGGLAGYAHVWDQDTFNARRGLALDVPLGLVDFVEILQMAASHTHTWFDYLNLGFKLTPTAGTDYPYHPFQPGAFRNYVNVGTRFTPLAWFEALRQGKTFVTDGPMLDVVANGQGLGSELNLKSGNPIVIRVKASMNPDLGLLDRLELIEQGEVVRTASSKEGSNELRLDFDVPARHGTWYVVRAFGQPSAGYAAAVVVSAPIYVRVDGESFWKPQAIPEIVSRIKQDLDGLLHYEPEDTEGWETQEISASQWDSQKPVLAERIRKAKAAYDKLVASAQADMASNGPSRLRAHAHSVTRVPASQPREPAARQSYRRR